VCQNECQRAIGESISLYETQMTKVLGEAKETLKETLLGINHKQIRESCVAAFKTKAVG